MKKLLSILFSGSPGGALPKDDLVLKQRLRLFNITTLFALLVFGVVLYQVSFIKPRPPLLFIFIAVLFTLIFINYLLLIFFKKPKINFWILIILMFTMLHILSYGQGGIRNAGIFYLAAIIFTAYILLGNSGGKTIAVLSIAHVIYFYLISTYTSWTDYSLIGTDPGLIDLDFLISGTLSIIVLTAQANYIEKTKNAVINDINSKKNDLELKHQELLNSQKALNLKNAEYEEKNNELEQFVYIASHDLHEPLRTTSGFVDLFQRQYKGKLDEKADSYLSYITQATQRMKTLINDLLEYSRLGNNNELKTIDCNILLKNVLTDLGIARDEANATVSSADLPVIKGHPTAIKQLFQNLIANSIKFRRKEIAPHIDISAVENEQYWKFSFADNGIGIKKQHHEKIFEIFQRLYSRNEYDGSGIGLAHCKKIVELHQGTIWVESDSEEGSTFHFTIQKSKV
jgi:signal transduction histidine kinase